MHFLILLAATLWTGFVFPTSNAPVEAALRGKPSFAESVGWVRDAKPGEPDFGKGKKWVSKHQNPIDKRIGEASTVTMGIKDGRTQEEAGAL